MNRERVPLQTLRETICDYLTRYGLSRENPPWELRPSPLGEFGIFSQRDIETGEVIFRDRAVFLGPRFLESCEFCVCCFGQKNIEYCLECSLPICDSCARYLRHVSECNLIRALFEKNNNKCGEENRRKLFSCLCYLRAMLLKDEDKNVVRRLKAHKGYLHGIEVDVLKKELGFLFSKEDEEFLRHACGAMDTNGFQLDAGEYETGTTLKVVHLQLITMLEMHSVRCGPVELTEKVNEYLKKYAIYNRNHAWKIRLSTSGGYGLFSNRNIEAGEILFKDRPLLLGPRISNNSCVNCFSKCEVRYCRKCSLFVCVDCRKSEKHKQDCDLVSKFAKSRHDLNRSELLTVSLIVLRSLMLNDVEKSLVKGLKALEIPREGCEVDILKDELKFGFGSDEEEFLRFVCGVLATNTFQVAVRSEDREPIARGLYPLASLSNHSCCPNITHVFDDEQHMVTRAAVFIPKDTELFHSYTRVTWGTSTRLYHLLKTKHFICKCERCLDPTEFGTYMNSVLCKSCKGKVVPVDPLKPRGRWICEDCKSVIPGKEAENLLTLLSSVLKGFSENTGVEIMLKYLKGKLSFMAPENNQVAVEVKLKIIWTFGYEEQYKWKKLSTDQLMLKKELCMDVLELLAKLRAGQCKLRGLLLYELCCTERELTKRDLKEQNNNVINTALLKNYLDEAADILLYDVAAPKEIKEKCTSIL